jgi:hypothetical protein
VLTARAVGRIHKNRRGGTSRGRGGPCPQPRARESHSAGVGHAGRTDIRATCPRACAVTCARARAHADARFYARAGRVPPGDCGALGGSGGASPALAFLLLLVLLSLRPCFLSCSSDVLRDAHVHGCVRMEWDGSTREGKHAGRFNVAITGTPHDASLCDTLDVHVKETSTHTPD